MLDARNPKVTLHACADGVLVHWDPGAGSIHAQKTIREGGEALNWIGKGTGAGESALACQVSLAALHSLVTLRPQGAPFSLLLPGVLILGLLLTPQSTLRQSPGTRSLFSGS